MELKLSKTAKMPGPSFGLPALTACPTGAKLATNPNSICARCYALKGNYIFKEPKRVRNQNLNALKAALEDPGAAQDFVQTLSRLIIESGTAYFRWHDSGDLLDIRHLALIVAVCRNTPQIKHWLPTREHGIVRAYLDQGGDIPPNLVVRLSMHLIGQAAPNRRLHPRVAYSTVADPNAPRKCPATHNKKETGGACGTCRACWTASVLSVDYAAH